MFPSGKQNLNKIPISLAILTISDRCAKGQAQDLSGLALQKLAEEQGWTVQERALVADEKKEIAAKLLYWCDREKISLILTTGGTGLGPRDVTPEATKPLLEKEVPGLGELMRQEGLKHTPLAVLSRSLAGIRGTSLILNLPGSPKGAVESLNAVLGVIPHALSILGGAAHEKATP